MGTSIRPAPRHNRHMTWVAGNRSAVVTVTYIGFRMVNTADNTPFLGKLTLKDWPGQWFANVQGWSIIPARFPLNL